MYDPVKDGVAKTAEPVVYVEVAPRAPLQHVVHCFWELRSQRDLSEDFVLHALPDACVNLLFNQLEPDIAGVTQLHTTHLELNLGKRFHYAGIQLLPGMWRGDPDAIVDRFVGEPYVGDLPLVEVSRVAAEHELAGKVEVFSELVERLLGEGSIVPNRVMTAILLHLDEVRSVADMARAASLSPRQLQRTIKATTGLAPHDLLKVLRVQRSFREEDRLAFADQAHYIHSFRRMTGFTPRRFAQTFDV